MRTRSSGLAWAASVTRTSEPGHENRRDHRKVALTCCSTLEPLRLRPATLVGIVLDLAWPPVVGELSLQGKLGKLLPSKWLAPALQPQSAKVVVFLPSSPNMYTWIIFEQVLFWKGMQGIRFAAIGDPGLTLDASLDVYCMEST